MNYLIDVWKIILSPFIKNLWESISFWRYLALIVLSLIVIVFTFGFKFRNHLKSLLLKSEELEHDRNIFKRSDEIMSERILLDFLDELQESYSYINDGYIRFIYQFCSFFREEGNRYLKKRLHERSLNFVSQLNILRDFTSTHFFDRRDPQRDPAERLFLNPLIYRSNENVSEKDIYRYEKLQEELNNHINTVREAYKQYRIEIKKILAI